MESSPAGGPVRQLPLGRSGRRLRFERRLRLFLFLLSIPTFALAVVLLAQLKVSWPAQVALLASFALCWLLFNAALMEQIVRPLQTLANVVAALREDDYSFRARGASRDDALGDLALEINALANTLQAQRVSALEATALLQRVVDAMETPVLTFDSASVLRLLNPAATRLLGLNAVRALGRHAHELGLSELLVVRDEGVISLGEAIPSSQNKPTRWMVRRTTFRQHGVPQTLLLLTDVSSALREEERQAWQRLIRVLGHEINNSLAPIKSIAGSLRYRLQISRENTDLTDFERGLAVIEGRAEALNRFVQAYRQLAQLPDPTVRRVPLRPLLENAISLETRLRVDLLPGPELDVSIDPDQIEQLLINLLKNAVEAATEMRDEGETPTAGPPWVQVQYSIEGDVVVISVRDNGPGLTNESNLFVPFYTTKKSGSGVGLVLARQIAEAHGGSLTLANRAEETGCEASIRLPRAR